MRKLVFAFAAASLIAPGAAMAADYAPIDCAKAKSASERTICKSYDLGQADARMATLYGIATSLVGMGQRGDIQDAQRVWLKKRDDCGKHISCLTDAYDVRIHQLNKVIEGIASHGPF